MAAVWVHAIWTASAANAGPMQRLVGDIVTRHIVLLIVNTEARLRGQ
jgi:hypothetical protein